MLSIGAKTISRKLTDSRTLSPNSMASFFCHYQRHHQVLARGLATHLQGVIAVTRLDQEPLRKNTIMGRVNALNAPTPVCQRFYVSRAHPSPVQEISVKHAIDDLLDDIRRRIRRKGKKWTRNQEKQADQADQADPVVTETETTAEFSHPDETVELALNLNLDPRKPGQALRGSISLPHGSGKRLNCVVFTNDPDLQEAARKAGASHAGGEALVDEVVVEGSVPVDSFQCALATPDMMPILSRKAARLLGPRGLMPNPKSGTLLSTPEELLAALKGQLAGKDVPFRTDKEGIVHVVVGKASFGQVKLLENIGQVMKAITEAKPEHYGKGKKGKALAKSSKGTKYVLRAFVSSTQGPGIRLDLRTVDPASAFFLASVVEKSKIAGDSEDSQEVNAA